MIRNDDGERAGQETMAVAVLKFGSDPIPLTLKVGATVSEALDEAGVEVGNADLFVSGEKAHGADVLEDGDTLSIVSSKQAG